MEQVDTESAECVLFFPSFTFHFGVCVRVCTSVRNFLARCPYTRIFARSLSVSFAHPHKVNYVESIIARLLPRFFGESAWFGAVPPDAPTFVPLSISDVPQPFHRSILVKRNRCWFPAYDGCSIREALPMFGALHKASPRTVDDGSIFLVIW